MNSATLKAQSKLFNGSSFRVQCFIKKLCGPTRLSSPAQGSLTGKLLRKPGRAHSGPIPGARRQASNGHFWKPSVHSAKAFLTPPHFTRSTHAPLSMRVALLGSAQAQTPS